MGLSWKEGVGIAGHDTCVNPVMFAGGMTNMLILSQVNEHNGLQILGMTNGQDHVSLGQ